MSELVFPEHPTFQLFVMFLTPFLNSVCSVTGSIIRLREAIGEYHCYEGVDVVGGNV